MIETWAIVPTFPNYEASDLGKVRLVRTGDVKHFRLNQRGYLCVRVYVGGEKWKLVAAHRMILEAFVGLRPEGMECRHLNGVKTDNRLANLRWGTQLENHMDSVRLCVVSPYQRPRPQLKLVLPKGKPVPRDRLSEEAREEIATASLGYGGTLRARELAEKWGISPAYVNKIRGEFRKKQCLPDGRRRLNASQVQAIRSRILAGESKGSLGREFGVSQTNISLIERRQTWREVA